MAIMGGFWGKMIEINLTTKTIEFTDRHVEYLQDFGGGRGLAVRLLWEALKDKPGYDCFGEEAPVIFTFGAIAGTPLGPTSRFCVYSKSSKTRALNSPYGDKAGTIGYGFAGGQFGPAVKMAGYDAIYITGKSDTPVVIKIDEDDKVELVDGSKYWGMGVQETDRELALDFGHEYKRAMIGPAGENLIGAAAVISEVGHAAARGGNAAVLGSKKVKALIAKGYKAVPTYDHDKTLELRDWIFNETNANSGFESRRRFGTALIIDNNNLISYNATKNHGLGCSPVAHEIGIVPLERTFWVKHRGCYQCIVRCTKTGVIPDGKYKGLVCEGPEYETGVMLGTDWCDQTSGETGMSDMLGACEYVDDAGLDGISAGGIVAFAMEAYENGVIKKEDIGGIDLTWGNIDGGVELLKLMVKREGEVPSLLADGSMVAALALGGDSIKYAMQTKNLEYPAWAVQTGGLSRAVGYGTNTRGGCHMAGTSAISQRTSAIRDTGIYCTFSALGIGGFSGQCMLLNGITGLNLTDDQWTQVGERIINLEKCFNSLEGFTREDDAIAWKAKNVAFVDGPGKGAVINAEENETALDEYYTTNGWDLTTSYPTVGKLRELGMDFAVPYIEKLS